MWHGCIRAIVPPLRGLHGHWALPIWMVVWLHGVDKVAFRAFIAQAWCRVLVPGASLSFLIFGLLSQRPYLVHDQVRVRA